MFIARKPFLAGRATDEKKPAESVGTVQLVGLAIEQMKNLDEMQRAPVAKAGKQEAPMDEPNGRRHLPPPESISAAGTISSLIASLRVLGDRFLELVTLEGKQAGVSLAFMLGFGLAAAVLLITGWLALIAFVVVALVAGDIVGWLVALLVAALLSLAGAGGLALLVVRRSKDLLFTATRRQLRRDAGSEAQHE